MDWIIDMIEVPYSLQAGDESIVDVCSLANWTKSSQQHYPPNLLFDWPPNFSLWPLILQLTSQLTVSIPRSVLECSNLLLICIFLSSPTCKGLPFVKTQEFFFSHLCVWRSVKYATLFNLIKVINCIMQCHCLSSYIQMWLACNYGQLD